MKRYCLSAHIELLRNNINIMRRRRNKIDYRTTGRVCDGLVYIPSGFHNMQVSACKYASTYLRNSQTEFYAILSFADSPSPKNSLPRSEIPTA